MTLTSFRCRPAVSAVVGAGREFMIAIYCRLEGFDECRQRQADCLNETPATSVPDGHDWGAGVQLWHVRQLWIGVGL